MNDAPPVTRIRLDVQFIASLCKTRVACNGLTAASRTISQTGLLTEQLGGFGWNATSVEQSPDLLALDSVPFPLPSHNGRRSRCFADDSDCPDQEPEEQ